MEDALGARAAKPPIWRRLLVPADVSLARLHDIIQAVFGWPDSHLHVFETAYGSFGRAAPPDDCGGIWGYAELVEILADPDHPEHKDRLGWLGLDHPSEFDPAGFDVHEINRALAALR